MDLKPGYKQTELGVIPKEWVVKKIKDCCRRITVGFVGTCDPFYTRETHGVLLLRTGNLQDSRIDLSDAKYVTKKFHAANKKSQVNQGDILIARHGNFGSAVLVPPSIDDVNALNIVIIRTDDALLLDRFAVYFINSDAVKGQTRGKAAGSTQVVINTGEIAELFLAVPEMPEQRMIATVLSDMDAMLAKLDALIAKKRDLKQAAMQQLLTGQTRLPGFSEAWEVKRLGDFGRFLKGRGVRKDDAQSGDLPCIRYGEIYTHHNDYIKSFNSWISPKVAKAATLLKQGDLLFAGSGETKEEIGKCVAFIDNAEAYAGGDIVILRPADANAMFLGYCCNTGPINAQKASKGQGDAVVHISANALASIEVTLPGAPEQTAIAAVLFDMDAEIATLEARSDKTRALKQGMMQELLTGRIRLV